MISGTPLIFRKELFMVRKFVAVALIVAGLGLSACNTVEGAGKDVKSAGSAVEGAAKDAK